MKKVSVIIVNWNGKDVLSDCLESLLKQDYANLEIWVSDNGSEDGSQAMVKKTFPSVRLLENGENLGFGSAINRVLQKAEGDYFLFLNNDLELTTNCVKELVILLDSDPQIGAAVPKILYHSNSRQPSSPNNSAIINSFGVLINYTGIACPNLVDEMDRDNLSLTETACGGIFMFTKEVYERVGGFDDDLFLYHEDHDLSWRIRLGGWKLMVNPRSICNHHYNFNKGMQKFYWSEKNRLHILLKNLEYKTLILIFPALVVIELAQIAHALTHGWTWLKLKIYFELFGQFPQIARKRRQIRSLRKVSDKEICRLYQGTISVSGMKNPLIDFLLSPILSAYWKLIRGWI
jgi:GT2 family glycosyltransferase